MPNAGRPIKIGPLASDLHVGLVDVPAFSEQNREGIPTPPGVIKHITPLGWQHISLTGDYIWTPTNGVDLRPLRRETSILAA